MRTGAMILALILALPGTASGNTRQFRKLVNQAEKLYQAGKYKESAERLIEAYGLKPHPRLIYNIARAYDQAGELKPALEYYQRYMGSQEGTDPTLLKRSSLAMDRLRGLIDQQEEARRKKAEEQARLEAEAKAAKERAAAEAEAARHAEMELKARAQAEAEARAQARSRNRTISFVMGGVALAGLGAGTWFGLSANGSKAAFTAAETVEAKQTLRDQTRTQALIADAGFVVGLAGAVTAALLYPWGGEEEVPAAAFVPAPGGAGMVVRF